MNNLKLKNDLKLKRVFPKIKKEIKFNNKKLKVKYKKDNLKIVGEGEVLLQNEKDQIKYKILKKKKEYIFNTTLNISKNPFQLNLLNYQKDKKSLLELNLQAKKVINKIWYLIKSLKKKDNIVLIMI